MAVKREKKARSAKRRLLQAVKGGPFRLRNKRQAGAPTPPDPGVEPRPAGVLRFDSEKFHLPESLAVAGETESNGALPGRVMLIITVLMIVFISIMAWFVSQMPEK